LRVEIVLPDWNVDSMSTLHLEICIILFYPVDTSLGSFETSFLSADKLLCMLNFDINVDDLICLDTLR